MEAEDQLLLDQNLQLLDQNPVRSGSLQTDHLRPWRRFPYWKQRRSHDGAAEPLH